MRYMKTIIAAAALLLSSAPAFGLVRMPMRDYAPIRYQAPASSPFNILGQWPEVVQEPGLLSMRQEPVPGFGNKIVFENTNPWFWQVYRAYEHQDSWTFTADSVTGEKKYENRTILEYRYDEGLKMGFNRIRTWVGGAGNPLTETVNSGWVAGPRGYIGEEKLWDDTTWDRSEEIHDTDALGTTVTTRFYTKIVTNVQWRLKYAFPYNMTTAYEVYVDWTGYKWSWPVLYSYQSTWTPQKIRFWRHSNSYIYPRGALYQDISHDHPMNTMVDKDPSVGTTFSWPIPF
jgi:hypothetical protein